MAGPVAIAPPFLREGGETGALMRAIDWDATAMGPVERWPQSLKTAVSLLLRARQPMFIGWGKQLISFYNDGYIPICGAKHPQALGQPMSVVWKDIWDSLSPLNEAVLRGESLWFENQPFDLGSRSNQGPSYFTFSYTPLLDDDGSIGGIFCCAVETTTTVLHAHDVSAAEGARQALLEKEEQLRLATDAAEVGMWDSNIETGWIYWGPRVRAMFGITHDRPLTLDDFYQGVHPDDRAATLAAFSAASDPARRIVYDVEYRTIGREDGLVRWVAAKGRGLFDPDGRCRRVIGTAIDITSRKDAELAMEVALEASRTGTFHWNIQTNTLNWDAALDRLFGLVPGQVVRSLEQFVQLVHPEDRAEVVARCERCRDEAADFEMEFRVVYPDGSVHWLYDRGRTFVDADGRAKTMTGACVDVTQRREAEAQAQAALQASERELRALADNSPDVIARFDRQLRHVFVNAEVERLTGLPIEKFIGRTNEELGMPAALCRQWNEAIRSVLDEGRPVGLQFEQEFGGVGRHLLCRLVPEFGPDGTVEHVLGVTRDFTELWQAQEALRGADRQKDEFLATLAHELRNPLAPLRTGLELLKKADSTTDQQRVRDIMDRQLNHMVRLVDELLDIARISQGKIVLQRESLQLQTVLEQAVEAASPWLDAQAHRLDLDGVHAGWHVHGDLTRLVQVVGNLLNNAAKYTPRGGRIALRASEERDGLSITVQDNGVGIAKELLPRVFDRFVQAEHQADRSQGGLGIGLSVVKSLVEMHGGSVRAESGGRGAGSRFTVWLPRAPAPSQDAHDHGDSPQAPVAAIRKILIVDDNRDAAETLAMIVGMSGHEVHLAHDGPTALQIAQLHGPDIVFLDIGMPGMNGYEAAVKLRALPGWQDRVLVALTGWGGEEDRAKSLRAGFDVHLTKPVDMQALDSLLAQAVR